MPKEHVRQADLSRPLNLARRFDLVLCLEVAEHLEPASAATIIDTLTAHGDRILFSAAAPGQPGMHHVNCQWPDYWQRLFNARGFACDGAVRWEIWRNGRIEPWYRQNLMMAVGTKPVPVPSRGCCRASSGDDRAIASQFLTRMSRRSSAACCRGAGICLPFQGRPLEDQATLTADVARSSRPWSGAQPCHQARPSQGLELLSGAFGVQRFALGERFADGIGLLRHENDQPSSLHCR